MDTCKLEGFPNNVTIDEKVLPQETFRLVPELREELARCSWREGHGSESQVESRADDAEVVPPFNGRAPEFLHDRF